MFFFFLVLADPTVEYFLFSEEKRAIVDRSGGRWKGENLFTCTMFRSHQRFSIERVFFKSLAINWFEILILISLQLRKHIGEFELILSTRRFKMIFERPVMFWDLRGMGPGCLSVCAKMGTVHWCLVMRTLAQLTLPTQSFGETFLLLTFCHSLKAHWRHKSRVTSQSIMKVFLSWKEGG